MIKDNRQYFINKFINPHNKWNNVLYIHTPFCLRKCKFCYLASYCNYSKEELLDFYSNVLPTQVQEYSEIFEKVSFSSVYFGGGTPTIVSPEILRKLFESVPNFKTIPIKSIESSPETLTKEHLELLKEYQFDYISLGIQSLNQKICEKHNRYYCSRKKLLEISELIRNYQIYYNYDFIAFLNMGDVRDILHLESDLNFVLKEANPSCATISQLFQSQFSFEKTALLIETLRNLVNKYDEYTCVNSLLQDADIKKDTLYHVSYKLAREKKNFYNHLWNKYTVLPAFGYNVLSLGYCKNLEILSNCGRITYLPTQNKLEFSTHDKKLWEEFICIRKSLGLKI